MNFTPLKPLANSFKPAGQSASLPVSGAKSGDMIGDFSDALKKAINDLSALEENSGKKVNSLVTGRLENVHDIMIAMEKSKIGLNMAIEVRNKLIEGYKEVMRMQI